MIMKEEEILLPMTMDKLTDEDWYEIYRQTNEIGYCLYDPKIEWQPEGVNIVKTTIAEKGDIHLPSGSINVDELLSILGRMRLRVESMVTEKNPSGRKG